MELTALHIMNVILSDNPAASHFLLSVPLALFHQSRTHVDLTLIFNLSSQIKASKFIASSKSRGRMP